MRHRKKVAANKNQDISGGRVIRVNGNPMEEQEQEDGKKNVIYIFTVIPI